MPKARLNRTGRYKITKRSIDWSIDHEQSLLAIRSITSNGDWSDRVALRPGERAVVWCYVQGLMAYAEYRLGALEEVVAAGWAGVDDLKLPADLLLAGTRFSMTVQVIAETEERSVGRILACNVPAITVCDGRDESLDIETNSLLPVKQLRDDVRAAWRLDFSQSTGPVLLVAGERYNVTARKPGFQMTVLPIVLRDIYRRIGIARGGERWMADWLEPVGGESCLADLPEDGGGELSIESWEVIDRWAGDVTDQQLQRIEREHGRGHLHRTFEASHLDETEGA